MADLLRKRQPEGRERFAKGFAKAHNEYEASIGASMKPTKGERAFPRGAGGGGRLDQPRFRVFSESAALRYNRYEAD